MTQRDFALLAVLPFLATIACKGGEETDTDAANDESAPSVSAVIPSSVYANRNVEVAISGYGTHWTETVQIDFGAGITVVDYVVASETAIVAQLDVASDAATGIRDVIITQGDEVTPYVGAFDVRAPLDVTFEGTQAQGSILVATAIQHDPMTPFDATQVCDYFGCVYTNMAATFDLDGLHAQFDLVSPRYAEFLVLIDVLAETGSSGLQIQSGPSFASEASDLDVALDIAARTPKALIEGANAGSVQEAFGTEVWSLDAGTATFVSLSVTSDDVEAFPYFVLLDNTGSFVDGFIVYSDTWQLEPLEGEGPYYLVVWAGSGDDAYDYTIDVDLVSPPAAEADDTCATVASTTPLPIVDAPGQLNWFDDEDWYRVDVTSPNLGEALHIETSAGDDYADTLIDVYRGSACSGLERIFQSDTDPLLDPEYHEDVTTAALDEAGTYYVVVKSNEYYFDFAETDYLLDVSFVAP